MIKCQICQHDNPDGAEYCEDCGASLAAGGAHQSPPAAAGAAGQASTPATGASTPSSPSAIPSPAPEPQSAPANSTSAADAATAQEPATPQTPPASSVPGGSVEEAPATPPLPPAEMAASETASAPAASTPTPATGPSTGQNARLVAHRYGATSTEEYPLLGERLVVGRFDPETGPVDVDLGNTPESPQISRHHAEIYREEGSGWHVKDLGSTNGVFVKKSGAATFGPRITVPEAITNGDEIAFGNARFIFTTD